MLDHDQKYLTLLHDVLTMGKEKGDRTGTGTRSLFMEQLKFDMREGFPILTTKKVHWHSVMHEMLWMIRGDTNIKYLNDNGVTIWDEWADEKGELGPVYGKQWRSWEHYENPRDVGMARSGLRWIDQLKNVADSIKQNPVSRRHIVAAWNPGEIDQMALPPCHLMMQFNVVGEYIDLKFDMRFRRPFPGRAFQYCWLRSIALAHGPGVWADPADSWGVVRRRPHLQQPCGAGEHAAGTERIEDST